MASKRTIILFRPIASPVYRQGEIPVQLLALARMLMPSHDVRIVTTETGLVRKTVAQVKAELAEHLDDCSALGVTAMTGYALRQALDMVRFVKQCAPNVPVVWGGWHASLLPETTLQEPEIDFAVRGQGEQTFVDLVQALESGASDFSSFRDRNTLPASSFSILSPDPSLLNT